jgi:CRP-like cAMP-binding protein
VHQMTPTGDNRILRSLPPSDLLLLQPQLKLIDLKSGTVLHDAGAPVEYIYFPTSGMVSILAIMRSGDAIETAVIGREGVVGGSIGVNSSAAGYYTPRTLPKAKDST